MNSRCLRTAHWLNDESIDLAWPDDWDVSIRWPAAQSPVNPDAIVRALREPVGSPPFRELALGKARPVVVIDDLTRPTPSYLALDPLLDEFLAAGIPAEAVTVLVATGTHPAPDPTYLRCKIGERAWAACRVVVHDDQAPGVQVGKTSFGTPIIVDAVIPEADLVVGIGGMYPNNTAGFGGGFKLALGILGRRSITHLHLKHRGAGFGAANDDLPFRHDLEEIAAAIGLRGTITIHVDAEARPVRIAAGDYRAYYETERSWAAAAALVDGPGDADVVIANAYPSDGTLVSTYQKALLPLRAAAAGASRIAIASCFMGEGGHGLFPLTNRPTLSQRLRRQASVMSPLAFGRYVASTARRRMIRRRSSTSSVRWPVMLYRPGSGPRPALPSVSGIELVPTWECIVDTVRQQQDGRRGLRVVVYPCSPLQVLDLPASDVRFAGE